MKALLELSKEDFMNQVIIQFDSILDGFNNYKNALLTPICTKDINLCEKDMSSFLKEVYRLNENSLIIDFYISRLSEEEFQRLFDSLSTQDKKVLMEINQENFTSNYFVVKDESIIDFLTRLCTGELFFITFYFQKCPLTLWGNYDYKFPLFYISEKVFNMYLPLIKKYNLKVI